MAEGRAPVIGKLFSGAVHVELLPADEPFGMNQNDGADGDTGEAELVDHEGLASPADAFTTMESSQLGSDDDDVPGLLLGNQLQHLDRAGMDLQVVGVDLAITVVAERP